MKHIVLSLVIPYVDDPAVAANLRAVSKNTKRDVDAHHTDLLSSGTFEAQRALLLRSYVEMFLTERWVPTCAYHLFPELVQIIGDLPEPPEYTPMPWWQRFLCN